MGTLSALKVKNLKAPCTVCDGGGLYYVARTDTQRSWFYRYNRDRWMGLGAYPDVSLAEARERAADARKVRRDGLDPIAHREAKRAEAQVAAITLGDALAQYVDDNKAGWQSAKATKQWTTSLQQHAPHLMQRPIRDIDTEAIRSVLKPIWSTRTATASRVRGRLERIIDYATTQGWRSGENPARWRGHMSNLLPSPHRVSTPQHRAALPWEQTAAFMASLQHESGIGPLAMRFAVLTAMRTGEVIGATWGEVDMLARTWTVPASRMRKTRKLHKVPLSTQAVAVLTELLPLRDPVGNYVFSGMRRGTHLSVSTMLMRLRRMGHRDFTVHGFRSSFRDWVADMTTYQNHVAEQALAHKIPSAVEASYRRGDMFAHRMSLMQDWANFLAAPAFAIAA
jgi:integrase